MTMEIENDELNFDCPLLKIKIDEGACYDINAVAEEWVMKDILKIIENQFAARIDVEKAKLVCPKCKHFLLNTGKTGF